MSEELYDSKGYAYAYFDGDSIYTMGGMPIGYLDGDSIYTYSGRHVGYFGDGLLRDDVGSVVLYTKHSSGGPIKPINKIPPIKGIKRVKPIEAVKQIKPTPPVATYSWSNYAPAELFE